MINILIVDDQKSIRARLEYLVESVPNFQVVGIAENGLEAIAQVKALQPDIVLLDMEMPRMNGLMVTKVISEEYPQTKILMLSSHEQQEYVTKSISAGATGYLLKGASDEDILQAIQFVYKGYTHIGAGLLEKMLPVVQESTAIDSQLPSEIIDISFPTTLAPQAETEISQHQSASGTQQIFAWLIVTLSLTTGMYAMRQWLRKPLPALSYAEQSATVADTKFTGKIQPAKTFKIAAIDPGVVENIYVQVGEEVKVGQPLLTLKNLAAEDKKKQIIQEQQLTRQQQQSQRELSQLQEKLAIQEQQDAISQLEKQKQTAQLEYQQANEKLELLRQQAAQLNKYQVPEVHKIVKATEAGIVAELPVTVGDQIYAGNAVVGLAKLEALKIEVSVNARLINALSPQQQAFIQIGEGVTAQKFEGKIAIVNPLPTEKLNYLVEVEFTNPTNSLIIGQLAKVQFLPQTIAGGN